MVFSVEFDESLYFQEFDGILKMILIIFSVVKVVKCLILVGLLEVDIEVIFELI